MTFAAVVRSELADGIANQIRDVIITHLLIIPD